MRTYVQPGCSSAPHFIVKGRIVPMRRLLVRTLGVVLFALIFGVLAASASCAATVAAAASLQPALDVILPEFSKDTGIKMEVVYSASGNLAKQIENGAPFDLYMSADEKWARYLEEKGKVTDPRAFVQSPLVLWWKKTESPKEDGLKEPKVTVVIADPEVAPFGKLARKYLESRGLFETMNKENRVIIMGDVMKAALAAKAGGGDYALLPLSNAQQLGEGSFSKVSAQPQVLFIANVKGRTTSETEKLVEYLSTEKAVKLFFSKGFEMASSQGKTGRN